MAQQQNAKFFCENCNVEVPQNAKMCRHCGRFFSSVRCPKCGLTGPSSKFTNGCPSCGYAIGGAAISAPKYQENLANRKSRKKLLTEISKKSTKKSQDETLPSWLFVLLGVIVVGLIYITSKYLLNF